MRNAVAVEVNELIDWFFGGDHHYLIKPITESASLLQQAVRVSCIVL
jgi:hypothetical protein